MFKESQTRVNVILRSWTGQVTLLVVREGKVARLGCAW